MEYSHRSFGGIKINLLILVVLIGGIAFYWQRAAERQKEEEAQITEQTYISPAGEFAFTYPSDWLVNEFAEEEGVVIIELYGPRNQTVGTVFTEAERERLETSEDAFSDERFREVINTPVGKDFVVLTFEVLVAEFFELPSSPQAWKDELLSVNTATSGINYSGFEPFSAEGADGFKYNIAVFDELGTLESTGYYLLGERAEAEISSFPADSNFSEQVDQIVSSMVITTEAEAAQFLQDLEPTVPAEE